MESPQPSFNDIESQFETTKGSSLSPQDETLKNESMNTPIKSKSLIHLDSKEFSTVKQGLNKFTQGLRFLKQFADKASKGSDKQQEIIKEKITLSLTETEAPLSDCSISPKNNEDDKKPASEELKLVVNNKLENLEKALAEMNTFEEKIYSKVEEAIISKEQQLIFTLDQRFEEYHALLDLKKKEIQEKVVSHFSHLREKVRSKQYPHESQYEAKTKALEWKNIVKTKIESWNTTQTIEVANNIIEEDETSMAPEIKLWMSRVENMLNMGNLDTLVDRSFLVFDEESSKNINSLSEFKIVFDERDILVKPRSSMRREKSETNEGTKSDEGSSPDKMDKVTAVSKLFKAFQLKVDSADVDKLKLKPTNVLSLPTSVSKEKKKKQFMFENYEEVQRLEIQCEEFKDKHLNSLCEALEFLTSVRTLHISLIRCDQIRDAGLEVLGAILGALPSLQSLTFEQLSSTSKITEEGFTKFIKLVAQNSNIKTLSLSFDKLSNISNKGWTQQWKEFSTMTNLCHIVTVVPSNIELEDDDLFTIATNVKLMTKLEGFEITLHGNEKLSHKGFSYLSEALCKLISLHTLKIAFKEHTGNLNDRSFSNLIYPLSKLVMLRSLSLELPKCYISQEKFVEFSQSLSKLSHLKQLDLNLGWSLIGDECLVELAKALPFLLYLTELKLDFTACSISNNGFIELVSATTGLFNLTSLNFNFSWCKELTDEGIEHLSQIMSKLNNLKNLELSFKEVKKITESNIVKFCGNISKFNNIEDLVLDLENCGRDINEESQSKIEEALSSGRKYVKSQILIAS